MRDKFESQAKATAQALTKATDTADKAVTKLIDTYAHHGEIILHSGLSAAGWAWMAEHTQEEEDTAKAIAREDGKRAQPKRLQSYQRMLNIAKKTAESNKVVGELLEEYRATLNDGQSLTIDGFATWCASGKTTEPKAPKGWDEYLKEAIRKAINDGASEDDIVSVFMSEIRNNF